MHTHYLLKGVLMASFIEISNQERLREQRLLNPGLRRLREEGIKENQDSSQWCPGIGQEAMGKN